MAQLGQHQHQHQQRANRSAQPAQPTAASAGETAPSVTDLAREFTTELIRWRGNMTSESIVAEAFALARSFKAEAEKKEA